MIFDHGRIARGTLCVSCLTALRSDGVSAQIRPQRLRLIRLLPRKVDVRSAEMSVCSRLSVDRTAKIQHLNDSRRTKIEILPDDLGNLRVGKFSCSSRIDRDRHRLCHVIRKACRDDILRDVAGCVCCRAVYLGRILSGECSAAVACIAAVCIYDDLTACKT